MADARIDQFGDLGPEPWGWRLKRARERHAGISQVTAVERIGQFMLTSTGTLSRLEELDRVPIVASQRALACIATVLYGIDPATFGVSSADLPPLVARQLAAWVHGDDDPGTLSTNWYRRLVDSRHHLVLVDSAPSAA